MSSDSQNDTEHLPFNALRSRFERLTQDGSAPTSPSRVSTPSVGQDETPKAGPSRLRTLSVNEDVRNNSSQSSLHIRTASSSADLKGSSGRRPPPPPPPRSPKPFLTPPDSEIRESISITPVDPSLPLPKSSLISRTPPPPPASKPDPSDGPSVGNVASLRNRFGSLTVAAPSLPSSLTGTAKEGFRSASHSSALGGNESLKVYGHPQRGHSLSIASKFNSDANPLIHFDNVEDRAPIPRLPSRQSSKSIESDSSTNSSRGPSLEFTYPSNPEILRRPPPPPSPSKVASRPPPRHSSLSVVDTDPFTAASECLSPSDSTTPTLQLPPPLPARKSPPPRAVSLAPPDLHETSHSAPPALERKSVANIQFAPPPVRTIALGDKLPPPRRQTSIEGSDSDSGEEDEPAVNLLPDATRASRRPPRATAAQFARANIPVPAHSGVIAVAGPRIVVGHHHVKVYDLFKSDKYMHNIDLKDAGFDWRGREIKITSVTFRSAEDDSEKGRFAWLGTKDGCLWELDTLSGVVKGLRPSIHGAPVTHILRHGLVMITIDDNGKALVFMPDAAMGGCTTMLTASNPRVIRLPEKQAFAKVLCGMLWTSGGPGSGSGNLQINGGSQVRGPVVRVCDFLSASTAVKSSIPSEQIGSVLSGTVLQAQPNKVFLGHEGGCVSIWQVNVDGPAPACVEVVKVSASDVLCLEGVMDRLWAGGRNGVISAFDVEHRPWVVTNNWKAHEDLPVLELFLDSYSIERCGQLSVISVGRDGVARFWDGLLGINWIDAEIQKRESSFSSFRPLDVLIVSWNVDAAKPDALSGSDANFSFLDDVLHSVESPDIIAFGFQELIDLESRKMAAKTVFLGGKKKATDGGISEKVSRSYKMWHDRLILAVRLAMPPDCPYTVVHTENLVGLFSCIFVKQSARAGLRDVALKTVKRGIGGMYGNKGGIVARFVVDDSSICFINCHLAAGQKHVRARNADIAGLLEEKEIFASSYSSFDPVEYAGGGDGSMVLDHEIVFLNGDLNYRIDQRRDATIAAAEAGQIDQLLAHDQLLKEMKFNRGFRLRSFVEAPITFAPTYKYDRRSNVYDSSEKGRIPAWCDRILYRTRVADRVQNLHYRRYEADVSDHRPISAGFRITVKSVDHLARDQIKKVLEGQWLEQQMKLLSEAHTFFMGQSLL